MVNSFPQGHTAAVERLDCKSRLSDFGLFLAVKCCLFSGKINFKGSLTGADSRKCHENSNEPYDHSVKMWGRVKARSC